MNLNAYDDVSPIINKQLTWIDINKNQLLSREIKYREYVTISKRFNRETSDYEYFIIFLDYCPTNRSYTHVKKDDYGRVKINLKSIWNETTLRNYKQNTNIRIKHVEHSDDGDIYSLDI